MAGLASYVLQAGDCSTTANWKAEVELWKARYESTRLELGEFTESSLELEQELEKELHLSLQQNKRLKNDLRLSQEEVELMKENEKRHVLQLSLMQSQLHSADGQKNAVTLRLRQLEQENDNLEIANRNLTASLTDYLGRIEELAESKAIVEIQLDQTRSKMKESEQRLQDQVKELRDELTAMRKRSVLNFGNQEVASGIPRALGNASIDNPDNEIVRLRLLADGDFAAADQMSMSFPPEAESDIRHTLASICPDSSSSFHLLIDKFNSLDFSLTSNYGSIKAAKTYDSLTSWS